jgi:hypothetical protein
MPGTLLLEGTFSCPRAYWRAYSIRVGPETIEGLGGKSTSGSKHARPSAKFRAQAANRLKSKLAPLQERYCAGGV